MKTKKLKWGYFSQLSKEEFENPLLPLLELCCSETSLHYVIDDTHRFIRATACSNDGFRSRDYGEMFFFYERFLKHIEVLYALMIRFPDWKIAKESPFYQMQVVGHLRSIHDEDMFGGTTMRFEKLADREFHDLGIFMEGFFKFKSLRQWRDTLDDMIRYVFNAEAFSQYRPDAYQIFEYLDKLGEAMFLAYLIRGKAYMLSHYAAQFGIKKKKLVDAELSAIEE